MVGVTVLLTRPSRSRLRRVGVSIRCETLGISRLSSLKRFGPAESVCTTSTVHLSPMRDRSVLIVRHTGLLGSFIGYLAVSSHKFVRSPQKGALLRANFLWLFR